MRPLGITMKGVNGTGGVIQHNSNSTMAELVYEWNVWETQTMVLLSFMLQLFLLATGSLRRRNTNGVLKASIWLAYVGADIVAVYALGLFSQYEDKYKLRRESFGDTLPFLWVPFLLVHLGGPDSITAFSLDDNNLWLRHLLNLATQGVVALYVFWKSFHRINYSILTPAMFVFVSGIIKYGERVWALKSASRNGLGELVKLNPPVHPSKESYALQIVLLARGLFVGRTVRQLGDETIHEKFVSSFLQRYEGEERLKMVEMELGMMFDLLYTKANVLQRWTGVLFRCASQTLMVVAFLLFLRSEKGAHKHNRVNVEITYTLFTGAMFMEACSIAVVRASPWTRAHLKESSFLHGLCNFATSLFMCVRCNKRHQSSSSTSMGQFNFVDYGMAMKYKPTLLSKAICAIGLDKQWRNLWYIHHIDDAGRAWKGIISGVTEILGRPTDEGFGPMNLGWRLIYTLSLPFEHALYRLHIYTDLYISRHFADTDTDYVTTIMRLKEECETLSNYMMYLMVMYPSMLPVSTAAEDIEPKLLEWVSYYGDGGEARTKLQILEDYKGSILEQMDSFYPFEPDQMNGSFDLEQSLMDIKRMWLRLLMYAAGKCSREVHARQLSEGGELITFVWLLMVHHGLGDVARELSLFTSDEPYVPLPRFEASSYGVTDYIEQQPEPLYTFELRHQQAETAVVSHEREQVQLAHMMQDIVPQDLRAGQSVVEGTEVIGHLLPQRYLSGEKQQHGPMVPGGATEQDEAGTSSEAGRADNAATPSEIHDQVEKTAMQIVGSQYT